MSTVRHQPFAVNSDLSYLVKFKIQYSLLDIRYSKIFSILLFLFLTSIGIAQIPDTIPSANNYTDSIALYKDANILISDTTSLSTEVDSTSILEKKKKKAHNPKKAAMLGLAIPGAGHIYNKKYWKAPVIWGAFAGGVYAIQFNTSQHKLLKDAYCQKLVVESVRDATLNPCPDLSAATERQMSTYNILIQENSAFTSEAIKRERDSFDKSVQLSWIALIGGHIVLNGIWSYVDAHLKEFDVDEDLSLKLRPSFETIAFTNTSFVGMGVVLEF